MKTDERWNTYARNHHRRQRRCQEEDCPSPRGFLRTPLMKGKWRRERGKGQRNERARFRSGRWEMAEIYSWNWRVSDGLRVVLCAQFSNFTNLNGPFPFNSSMVLLPNTNPFFPFLNPPPKKTKLYQT